MINPMQPLLTRPFPPKTNPLPLPVRCDKLLFVFIALLYLSPDATNAQTIRVTTYNTESIWGGDYQEYRKTDYTYGLGWTNIAQTNLFGPNLTNGYFLAGEFGLIGAQSTNSTGWDSDTMLLSTNWSVSWLKTWDDTNQPTTTYSGNYSGSPDLPVFYGDYPYPYKTPTNDFAMVGLELATGGATNSRYPSLYRIYLGAKQWGQPLTNTAISLVSTIGTNSFTNVCDLDYFIYETWSDCITNPINPTFDAAFTNVQFAVVAEKVTVEFAARAGMMNQGYDPRPGTNEDHWTSLAVGGTNEITELHIFPDWAPDLIELKVTGPITVSQTNGFTDMTTPLTITSTSTGSAATNATIEIQGKSNHVTLATLQVHILPIQQVPVVIYRVQDSLSAVDTSLGGTESNAAIIDRLNAVFKPACVEFIDDYDVNLAGGLDLRYDIDLEDGRFDARSDLERDPFINMFGTMTNKLKIFLVNKSGIPYQEENPILPAQLNWTRGGTFLSRNPLTYYGVVAAEPTQGFQSVVAAHEVGHVFGLPNHDDRVTAGILTLMPVPPGEIQLMIDGEPFFQFDTDPPVPPNFDYSTANWQVRIPGTWLRSENWKDANEAAKTGSF